MAPGFEEIVNGFEATLASKISSAVYANRRWQRLATQLPLGVCRPLDGRLRLLACKTSSGGVIALRKPLEARCASEFGLLVY